MSVIRSAVRFAGSYAQINYSIWRIHQDAIFEVDFVEENESEEENSDSEDDGLPVNEGMFFPVVESCFLF